jgi:hypothetical protein
MTMWRKSGNFQLFIYSGPSLPVWVRLNDLVYLVGAVRPTPLHAIHAAAPDGRPGGGSVAGSSCRKNLHPISPPETAGRQYSHKKSRRNKRYPLKGNIIRHLERAAAAGLRHEIPAVAEETDNYSGSLNRTRFAMQWLYGVGIAWRSPSRATYPLSSSISVRFPSRRS